MCAVWIQRHNTVVLDLRDMWPDIFVERVPAPLMPVARAALWPLTARARAALAGATALFGITDDFLHWGLKLARRERTAWDDSFPLGYPRSDFNSNSQAGDAYAAGFWDSLGITRENAFNVVLVGAITRRRFELDAVLAAARELQHDPRSVRFVIAGDGDDLPMYRESARDCSNVVFPGWLSRPQIQALLARAHLGLVPYRNTAGNR